MEFANCCNRMDCARAIGYFTAMTRNDAIVRLQETTEAVRALGATGLFLYGSTARDEATNVSDLDIFIDYNLESSFNAFDLIGIKLLLEQELDLSVDINNGVKPPTWWR